MKNITILLFAFVVFLGGCANNSSREQEKQEKEKQRKLDSEVIVRRPQVEP